MERTGGICKVHKLGGPKKELIPGNLKLKKGNNKNSSEVTGTHQSLEEGPVGAEDPRKALSHTKRGGKGGGKRGERLRRAHLRIERKGLGGQKSLTHKNGSQGGVSKSRYWGNMSGSIPKRRTMDVGAVKLSRRKKGQECSSDGSLVHIHKGTPRNKS